MVESKVLAQGTLRAIAIAEHDFSGLLRSPGKDCDASSHSIAVRPGADQLDLQPVAGHVYAIFQKRVAIGGSGNGDVHDTPIPKIRNGYAAAVEQQIRAGSISYFCESAVFIAAKIAVALPAMPGRGAEMFWIKEFPRLINVLPGDRKSTR